MESQAVSYNVNETKRQGRIAHHHADATVPHIVALLGSTFHAAKISIYFDISKYFEEYLHKSRFYPLLPPILHNPVPCGNATGRRVSGRSSSAGLLPEGRKNADGLLGDAYDAAHGLVVHAHFIEDEKEKQALADCISKRFRTFAATNNIELCQSLPEHIRLNQAGIY